MVPVLVLAAISLVVGFGWRTMRREHSRVVDALKQAESAINKRAPVTLEKDPETGVYRPRRGGRD